MAEARLQGRLFGPTDVVTSAISTTHEVTLSLVHGRWTVAQDLYLDPLDVTLSADHHTSLPGPKQPPVTVERESNLRSASSGAVAAASASQHYYYASAIAYADKYWLNYNPFYLNYNHSGGDCANFVSQALWDPNGADLYGVNPYWGYFGGTNPGTASPVDWRYTPSQHKFFTGNPYGSTYNFADFRYKGTPSGAMAWDRSYMLLGSIHYYDWTSDGVIDHTAIAVGYLSDGSTMIDSHNPNHYHVRFDVGYSTTTYYFDQMRNTIYFH